ncbi:MAG: ATP-binding protein [Firmicutes bacterium]|nr:ATP-binding protein [Bacillota bacterium]
MLVNVTVENWMSFRDSTTLSMGATKERQHGERIPRVAKYRARVLPIAVLYGGNASGKTNFFKALRFVQRFVVDGTYPDQKIPVQPFLLDNSSEKPSRFSVTILVDETMYELSFAATRQSVLEEKLVGVLSSAERVLYHRTSPKGEGIVFDPSLGDQDFLRFAARGTRDNQLFLTNAVSQNISTFSPVYSWFKDSLHFISPDARFGPFVRFFERESPLASAAQTLLARLDTGVVRLDGEEVPVDELPISESQLSELRSRLREDEVATLFAGRNRRIVILRDGDSLTAKKMVAYHRTVDGSECKFDMAQESDGTVRIIDLLPAFVDLSEHGSTDVYVIDELDRNLHTFVTKFFIEMYMASCSSSSRSQLLFTTHDLLLMDQKLFRRDEMWITERDQTGVSTLLSFAEYENVRYDKDIRKSYLLGRLGGVPRVPQCPYVLEIGEAHEEAQGNES